MGFANASCSFTRFHVLDSIPSELWDEVPERLKKFAFQDIDNTAEMQAHGWVAYENLLDNEWMSAPPQKAANYFVFSLRFDVRRIPAGVIKKHLMIALAQEMEKIRMQGKQFIARERKKEIKEQVLLSLRQRFLPVPSEFNVLWNTENNEVWFASTQAKMIDLFQELFLQTFDLHLEPLTPYSLATRMLDEKLVGSLDAIEPTIFTSRS